MLKWIHRMASTWGGTDMPEKYVLSKGAKDFARMIVEEWDAGRAEQEILVVTFPMTTSKDRPSMYIQGMKNTTLPRPTEAVIKELALAQLVYARIDDRQMFITLLETLREAVANDFTRPPRDPAPGSTIYNVQQAEGSTFNTYNAAGNITINMELLADRVRQVLGEEILAADPDLKAAVDDLTSDDEESQARRFGNFLSALGRSAGHTASILTILQVLGSIRL